MLSCKDSSASGNTSSSSFGTRTAVTVAELSDVPSAAASSALSAELSAVAELFAVIELSAKATESEIAAVAELCVTGSAAADFVAAVSATLAARTSFARKATAVVFLFFLSVNRKPFLRL